MRASQGWQPLVGMGLGRVDRYPGCGLGRRWRGGIRRQPGWLRRQLDRGPEVLLLPRGPRARAGIALTSGTGAGLRGPRQPVRGPRAHVPGPLGPGAWAAAGAGATTRSRSRSGHGSESRSRSGATGAGTRVGPASAAGCGQGEPQAERQRRGEPPELHGERDAVSSGVGHIRHGVGDKCPSVTGIEGHGWWWFGYLWHSGRLVVGISPPGRQASSFFWCSLSKYSLSVYRTSTEPVGRANRVYHTACQVSQMVFIKKKPNVSIPRMQFFHIHLCVCLYECVYSLCPNPSQ